MRPDEFDASGWDEGGVLPVGVREAVARAGWFGVDLPTEYGGRAGSQAEPGELCAAIGAVCSSVRALITVQDMVSAAIARWGTAEQRSTRLPALAAGEHLAGFAATESGAGTELSAVDTRFEFTDGVITVTGEKRRVTFGREATVFLVPGKLDGRPATGLVETGQGVSADPVRGQLGLRAAMIAHVRFDGVRVPMGNLPASPGFGLSHVVATALDHGRFTVAWGCAGMAAACVADVAEHTVRRRQDAVPPAVHQLVRVMQIIEGSDQVSEPHIADHLLRKHRVGGMA